MLDGLRTRIRTTVGRFARDHAWSPSDQYVTTSPNDQQTVDLFAGEWSSVLPLAVESGGAARLFDDERVHWMLDQLGGVAGWRVLELGPLEGGHSAMIEHAGVGEIVAIEANKVAYLKCLVVKELLGLRARFLLGDFDKLLAHSDEHFDLIVASGVLYHMIDPLVTIRNMMRLSRNIFIWSHFFDDAAMPAGDQRRTPMTGKKTIREIDGDALTYHDRSYRNRTSLPKFCGGIYSKAVWIERGELIDLLLKHGYETLIAFDEPDHIYGPASCILATKERA